jgi:hypothetical protein
MFNELIFGASFLIGLVSYAIYFKSIYDKKTKPNGISWFIWAIIIGLVGLIQLNNDVFFNAIILLFSALVCFVISILGIYISGLKVTKFDFTLLVIALFGIYLWQTLENPLYAVIAVTFADSLAMVMTFKKTINNPYSESLTSFSLNLLKFFLSFLTLEKFDLINSLYSINLLIINIIFIATIYYIRQKQKTNSVNSC